MLGTSSPGGVSTVIEVYRESGLFDRWPIVYLATHTDIDANRWNKFRVAMTSFLKYCGLLIRGRVAILHAHTSARASFWRKCCFILPAMAVGRPVIFHLHSGEFTHYYDYECGPLGKWVVRFVLNHCAKVIVLSKRWQAQMTRITSNPAIIPILNPIKELPTTYDNNVRDPATLLYLGRLVESKGIYVLLEAVAQLSDEFADLRLLCAGDGDTDGVTMAAKERGIAERVELLGWVDRECKQKLLSSSTISVLPSFAEGLPMSVLESMAAGLPVIATNVGGIPDVLKDRSEGIIVTPGDVSHLALSIRLLLDDNHMRQEMGRRGRQRYLNEFCADVSIPQLEAIYSELGAHERTVPGLG